MKQPRPSLADIPYRSCEPSLLGDTWILRIEPDGDTPDPVETDQHDLALWLIAEALDDKPRRRIEYVYKRILGWDWLDPRVAIIGGLWHRQSPFAVGYHSKVAYQAGHPHMLVLWRRRIYTRDRRGILTPTDLCA